MSDSRYGIIEKLTQQKTILIKKKVEAEFKDVNIAEKILDTISNRDERLSQLKASFVRDTEQAKIDSKNIIEGLRLEKKNASKRKKMSLKSIEEQIKAIDKGLAQLTQISELHTQSSAVHTEDRKKNPVKK